MFLSCYVEMGEQYKKRKKAAGTVLEASSPTEWHLHTPEEASYSEAWPPFWALRKTSPVHLTFGLMHKIEQTKL